MFDGFESSEEFPQKYKRVFPMIAYYFKSHTVSLYVIGFFEDIPQYLFNFIG